MQAAPLAFARVAGRMTGWKPRRPQGAGDLACGYAGGRVLFLCALAVRLIPPLKRWAWWLVVRLG